MKHTAYLLLLDASTDRKKLSESTLREVKRILGPDVCPLLASGNAVAIGFIATEAAQKTGERVRQIVGPRVRISVLELGLDQAQWGLQHHNEWLEKLRWMTATTKFPER
jgi:hypothetical protein